jgi:hypothetical protein
MKRRAATLAVATMMALGLGGTAMAQPPPMTTVCENQGGNQPPGQQDKCQGQGLEEAVENPAGKRPPGQQP